MSRNMVSSNEIVFLPFHVSFALVHPSLSFYYSLHFACTVSQGIMFTVTSDRGDVHAWRSVVYLVPGTEETSNCHGVTAPPHTLLVVRLLPPSPHTLRMVLLLPLTLLMMLLLLSPL